MHSDPLVAELAAIVGEPHVLTAAGDTARYCSDWRGRCGHRPGRRAAGRHGRGRARRGGMRGARRGRRAPGGNTGLVGGSTPDDSGAEIVLSLERLSRVRRVDPLDNSMTLEAGCTVLAAQEAAAVHGKLFPLALASQGTATIGGVVSTNAGGEQVVRYGNTRELTLGVEAVLADGSVLDVLTPLRKDNTGYDLKQLFIGAEGTLGIVTAATFKLFSAPRKAITAWASVPDPRRPSVSWPA